MSNQQARTAHASTQAFGLALITASVLVLTIVTFALLDGEDGGFIVVVALVSAAATFVVWRFDRLWSRIVGLVTTVLLVMVVFFLAFGLMELFSPLEFIVGLTFVLGVVLALGGGMAAIIAGRKDKTGSTPREARLRSGVLALIGVAAVISITGYFMTRSTVSNAEATGATQLDMKKFEFSPSATSVPVGETILLTNSDPFVHNLKLDEADIFVEVGPGSEALIDLGSLSPGTYDYICSLHSDGSKGMTGIITIES